jgi:hypothetical protein
MLATCNDVLAARLKL